MASIVQWDELNELHILKHRARAQCHGHSITGGVRGIGRPRIDLPGPAGGQHDRASRQHELATRPFIQHNGPAATSGVDHEIYGKVMI